jgi:DNA-binding beta-propeller fold protein YncE
MNDLNPSRKLTAWARAGVYLFLLADLLAVATPLRADNPPAFLFQWGSQGTNNGQFATPFGVAIDSRANVYVTDINNVRIEKFDRNGNYLIHWGGFSAPYGIAVDHSNNVYVSDLVNDFIKKFDSNGNYLTQWGSFGGGNGQFANPSGIAIDSSNNVYVSEEGNDRVQKFDSNGNYLTKWGSQGNGNGQFTTPFGVAVDSSNNVYVADTENFRVQKFDSNGNYLTQWGSFGSGNGQFNQLDGIAVDSSNNVYVTDNNSRVEKFDSNGNYLTQWGSFGSGAGQFSFPFGIALDGSGNFIYVADADNSRIQVFANNTAQIQPYITNQPASQNVGAGVNVSFSVGVFGGAPFGYQWISNNVAVTGATNATFTLTNVSLADSGSTYSVLVTNSYGSALSSNAMLTVLPAVALTQPASSITTTSAILNGSVTVGSDETVVWFEWGTDTNYGNIADETMVPGNSGSNSISAVLNGLPGNYYHYRLDAANDFGIVYGNDQSFTVGFAPTIGTLSVVNSTNGSTLNATVNPNGWDTTVYFLWGTSALTNSTPVMDMGAGATPLNVSSLITGLAPATRYYFQVVASNYLGTVYGAEFAFFTQPFTSAPLEQWQSVACSADGTKLVAGGPLWTSTNSGATWIKANTLYAEGVASSADGTKLIAGVYGGFIYISTNSGATWAHPTNTSGASWNAVASSADGTKLAAVAENAGVFTSTNSGVNWTHQTNGLLPYTGFTYIASSADGSKLVMAGSPIFTSTNFGINWTKATNAPLASWYSVASSADGNTLLACAYNYGNVYLSTNAGVIWTKTSLPAKNWNSVAESADGTKMVALANSGLGTFGAGSGGIYTSTDSGTTWFSNNVPSWTWTCAAMSADGNEIIATIGGASSVGSIYVSQTTPSPVLNLSASDNVLSWIIPSLDFTLQQSPDLMSWTDVTNLPVLNLTNLQNQVTLPPPDGSSFFRLVH